MLWRRIQWTGQIQSRAEGSGFFQMGLLFLLSSACLLEGCLASSSWHSLSYSYTFISEPSEGLPQFSILESLDNYPVNLYDSSTQSFRPLMPWMEKLQKEDRKVWVDFTQAAKQAEKGFRLNLQTLRKYYNHSQGVHTLQWRYGCEIGGDGHKGGSDQDGYDGRTFLSFDKETLSWTATDAAALVSKRKLEGEPSVAYHLKYYLEETCLRILKKRLKYGKESLLRKETPVVTVTSKAEADGMETLVCRAHGFYPKEIDASWRRDGEVWLQDTLQGSVVPNADGTFHLWLSVKIDPQERERYQCHVEHDSLQEPLVLMKKPAYNTRLFRIFFLVPFLLSGILCCAFMGMQWRKRILAQLRDFAMNETAEKRDPHQAAPEQDNKAQWKKEDETHETPAQSPFFPDEEKTVQKISWSTGLVSQNPRVGRVLGGHLVQPPAQGRNSQTIWVKWLPNLFQR